MPPVVVCGQLFDEAAWGQNGHQCLHRMSNHNNTSNGNNNKQYLQVTNAALTTLLLFLSQPLILKSSNSCSMSNNSCCWARRRSIKSREWLRAAMRTLSAFMLSSSNMAECRRLPDTRHCAPKCGKRWNLGSSGTFPSLTLSRIA